MYSPTSGWSNHSITTPGAAILKITFRTNLP